MRLTPSSHPTSPSTPTRRTRRLLGGAASLAAAVAAAAILVPAAPATAAVAAATMTSGQQLSPGQALWSPGSRYELVQQGDGNLVEYDLTAHAALWNTGTVGVAGARTLVQGDGNVVTYGADGRAQWNSQTYASGGTTLAMQGDGNVVLYTAAGRAAWSSWTGVIPQQGAHIVAAAAAMQNLPYCWGGGSSTGPTHGQGGSGCGGSTVGFDCSGLALYAVYQALHITLPHYTGAQATAGGTAISSLAALQPGDLAFFGGSSPSTSTHVAVYAGNGTFWDAATYGVPVGLRTTSWETSGAGFDGAVRYWS